MIETPPSPAELEPAVRLLVGQMAGRRLPPERELAARFGASRPRLRAVLAKLQSEGLVEARQGSGTFAVDTADSEASRLRRVGLVIDAGLKLGDDPFFSLLLERIQTACQSAGAGCLLSRFSPEADTGHLPDDVDGLITIGLEAGRAALAGRSGSKGTEIPLVTLLLPPDTRPTRRASVVQLDDATAGADAARLLIEQHGCRRLIFIGRESLPAAAERRRGAELAVIDRGVPLETLPCRMNYAAGLAFGRTLALEAGDSPGIIAANDWLAVGLRAGLQVRGGATLAHIPIASFDGLPLASDPALEIESLAVPLEDLARDSLAELERLRRSPAAGSGRALKYLLEQRS